MSIEKHLADLTAALTANTESNALLVAALKGGSLVSAPATPVEEQKAEAAAPAKTEATAKPKAASRAKPAAKEDAPKHDKAAVVAAVNNYKETFGTPRAKELLKSHGFEKLVDISADKFDAIFDEAYRALDEHENGSKEVDEDDDL